MDEPIPQAEEKTIVNLWSGRHNFELPDSQLLIPSVQERMWRDFNTNPPQLSVLLAEQVHTRSCISKTVGHTLAIVPGKAVVSQPVLVDEVEKSFELFLTS